MFPYYHLYWRLEPLWQQFRKQIKDKDVSKSRSIWQVGFGIFILPFNLSICINDMYWFPKTPWSMTMQMKTNGYGVYNSYSLLLYRYITRKCVHDFSGIVRTHQESTAFLTSQQLICAPMEVFFLMTWPIQRCAQSTFPTQKKTQRPPGFHLGHQSLENPWKRIFSNGVRFWNNQVLKKSSGCILLHTHYFGKTGPTRLMITKVKDVDEFGRNSITITHESERNINKDNKRLIQIHWYIYI